MLNMLDEVLYQPLGKTFCFSDINVLDEDGCASFEFGIECVFKNKKTQLDM